MKKHFSIVSILLVGLFFSVSAKDENESSVSKDVSVAEGAELIKTKEGLVILDVRTAGEYKNGHLEGATLVDFTSDDFEGKLAGLDRSKPYLVHCAVGGRSRGAVELMKKMNFTEIYHLEKGYKGWVKSKQPVTK